MVRVLATVDKIHRLLTKSLWRKLATVLVVLVFAVTIALQLMPARAATATLVPDTDVTTGWAVLGGTSDDTCAGGTHCDYVDEGTTAVTTDYIGTGTAGSGGEIEEFTLDTASIGLGATQIQLNVYAQSATNANGGTLDDISIAIRIGGTLQTATTCTPAFNSWAYCTATYSGTYTQANIDSLQARIVRTRQGSGGPSNQDDDVRLANVYATITYDAIPALTQASHRWFDDGVIGDAGVNWTSRTSAEDNSWRSVTYGNGLFVAVSDSGTGNRVMTSPNGINWTSRTSAADNNWYAVTYGAGIFVAVANTGTGNRVMTSPDGITWTSRTSAADNNWWSITYGNGLFVAVASSGTGNRVMTSPNGINWTSRTSAADNQWRSVTYGNGLFVAVCGLSGVSACLNVVDGVMTSPDGINWTGRTSAANHQWRSVTYGNAMFVAVSVEGTGNRVMTSPDGINWTGRTSAEDNNWQSVTYANGLFVAVAASGTGNRVMTSPDGITWTSRTSAADNNWNSVTYGNGLLVAVASIGTSNRVMTSSYEASVGSALAAQDTAATATATNARLRMNVGINTDPLPANVINMKMQYAQLTGGSCSNSETYYDLNTSPWSANAGIGDSGSWYSVTYGSGLFVAVGNSVNNYVMTSPDGINWTHRSAPMGSWQGVTYGGGLFVAVGANVYENSVMTSPDGINWTARASADDSMDWAAIVYGDNQFVAVSYDGIGDSVMTSPDGVNWTGRASATNDDWTSIAYGNNLYVATAWTGTDGPIMTSPDGITWTTRAAASSRNYASVTFGNGLFVAVTDYGDSNRAYTSPDGITWTSRATPLNNGWSNVVYSSGTFVATAKSGTGTRAMTSPDGINWTIRQSAADNSWEALAYGNGKFVAVSSTGTNNRVMTMSPEVFLGGNPEHDKASLVPNANDPTAGGTVRDQSYQTLNRFTNDKSVIADGEYGRWDFPIDFNYAQPTTTYCFRAVKDDNTSAGSLLNTYSFWPQITTAAANTVPGTPTLSTPTNTATGVATNPQLQLSATDTEGDYLRYKIEVCSTSNCSSIVRTIDQTSSQTGWTGQNAETNTAYTSGTTASHTYQAAFLSNSTQYWWRAYAIDPGGSNTFSSASSIFSFTTAAASTGGSLIQGGVNIQGGTSIGN